MAAPEPGPTLTMHPPPCMQVGTGGACQLPPSRGPRILMVQAGCGEARAQGGSGGGERAAELREEMPISRGVVGTEEEKGFIPLPCKCRDSMCVPPVSALAAGTLLRYRNNWQHPHASVPTNLLCPPPFLTPTCLHRRHHPLPACGHVPVTDGRRRQWRGGGCGDSCRRVSGHHWCRGASSGWQHAFSSGPRVGHLGGGSQLGLPTAQRCGGAGRGGAGGGLGLRRAWVSLLPLKEPWPPSSVMQWYRYTGTGWARGGCFLLLLLGMMLRLRPSRWLRLL